MGETHRPGHPPRVEGRWTRIPLVGDVEGMQLLLPDRPLSERNWQQFMATLDAMKPGLIEEGGRP